MEAGELRGKRAKEGRIYFKPSYLGYLTSLVLFAHQLSTTVVSNLILPWNYFLLLEVVQKLKLHSPSIQVYNESSSFALAFWNSFSKQVFFKVNFWVCFFTLASANVKHFCLCGHSLCITYFSWVLIFSLFLKSSSLSLNSRYNEY